MLGGCDFHAPAVLLHSLAAGTVRDTAIDFGIESYSRTLQTLNLGVGLGEEREPRK